MRRLTDEVKSLIRTGVALPNVTQVVEELLLNSIDAGASNIAVRVDLSCFKIQVVDNGHGITADQFELIGERYATSKCHSAKDLEALKHYGYRGEALASIKDSSSFFEIVSRAKGSCVTFSKCFQRGKQSLVSQLSTCRPSVGTTITVHDLFYNLPVRQNKSNSAIEMEKIRYRVASLALIWPKITVSLRNDAVGQILLQTKKSSGTLGVFFSLFPTIRPNDIMEMNAEKDDLSIWGFISKECHSQKDIQFVYINKRLVISSCIHKHVNRVLGQSLIIKRREQSVTDLVTSTGSPSKHTDLFGVYMLNISCPFDFYDITFDPKKTLVEFRNHKKLSDLIQDMIYSRFRKENLLSDELSLKTVSEQRDISSEKADDEQPEKNPKEGLTGISHSDILFSKPVKKCNKNLSQCFDDSNVALNQSDEAVSKIISADTNQPTVKQSRANEETFVESDDNGHDIHRNSDSESHQKHSGASDAIPSTCHHENKSNDASLEKSGPGIIRPLKLHNKPSGLNMGGRDVRKTNIPELSKISMDKSVKYVSTLSCLKEFASSKRSRTSINASRMDPELKVNPSLNVSKVPIIHTLTELKKATRPTEDADEEPGVHTSEELKKDTGSTHNIKIIHTLSELKKAMRPAENVNKIQQIHTLTELKNSTQPLENRKELLKTPILNNFKTAASFVDASKSSNNIETGSRLDTLTVLRTNNKPSTNGNVVLKTSCNIDHNVCGEDFTLRKTVHEEHQENVMLNKNNGMQIHVDKAKLNEFVSEQSCDNYDQNSPCILVKEINDDTQMESICDYPGESCDKKLDNDTSNSNERVSLPCDYGDMTRLCQNNDKPCESPVNHFDHCKQKNFTPIEFSEITGGPDTSINITSTNDVIESSEYRKPETVSSMYDGSENIATNSRTVTTTQSFSHLSSQSISSNESSQSTNHKLLLNLSSSGPVRQIHSSLVCSRNVPKGQVFLGSTSAYFPRLSSVSETLKNNQDCILSAELCDNLSSTARPPISCNHNSVSEQVFSGSILQSKEGTPTSSGANEVKKTGHDSETGIVNDESGMVLKGTFNLKSLMGFKLAQNLDSTLNSHEQLSILGGDKGLGLDLTLDFHQKSSVSNRKRKSSLDFELLAHVPSPKKFHLRLFENDLMVLRDKLLSGSLLLKSFIGQHIRRPLDCLGKYNTKIPALRSFNESEIPSTPLQIVHCNANTNSMPINHWIKTLFTSQCGSVQSGGCSNGELNVELIEDDKNPERMSPGFESNRDSQTGQPCMINKEDGSETSSENSLGERNVPMFEDNDTLHHRIGLNLKLASPNKHDDLPMEQEQVSSTGDLHSDTSKGLTVVKWKNPVFKKHKMPCPSCDICPNEASVAKSCYSFINGLEFTGGMLQSAKVIGQVEMKFIACIIEKGIPSNNSDMKQTMLVLFDQHAVHERIRLEALTSDAEETNSGIADMRLKRAKMNTPVTLTVSKDDARIVKAFQTEFQRIGVDFVLGESVNHMQSISIHSLPLCMTQRDGDGKLRDEEEMTRNAKDLIQDQIQHLKATNGVHRRLPLSVHRVLCSQACRGAIKFGDSVSLATCKQLMKQLSECCLPFQCAHGRPSVVPLVNLTSLEMHSEKRKMRPKLGKLSAHFNK